MQRTITAFTPLFSRFPATSLQLQRTSLRFCSEEVKNQVFVAGLPWSVDDENLKSTFSQFGNCTAKVVHDRETGRSRGFGFVTFEGGKEADAAIQGMNNQQIQGRRIFVNYANKSQPRRNNDNYVFNN